MHGAAGDEDVCSTDVVRREQNVRLLLLKEAPAARKCWILDVRAAAWDFPLVKKPAIVSCQWRMRGRQARGDVCCPRQFACQALCLGRVPRRCDDDDSDIEIMANFVHARTQPVEAYEVESAVGSLKGCQRPPLLEGEAIL